MSGLWLNIRFKDWFFQMGEPNWYNMRITKNSYHSDRNYPFGWFSIYEFRLRTINSDKK